MNTTLPRARSLDSLAQPTLDRAEFDALAPRISPLDRLSLRLGLWLLLRSTRRLHRIAPREQQARAHRVARDREVRERDAQRRRLLSLST
jgi:hypothetical protein